MKALDGFVWPWLLLSEQAYAIAFLFTRFDNTLRPILDGFVWPLLLLSEQAYAFDSLFTGFDSTLRPSLDGFVWHLLLLSEGKGTERDGKERNERKRKSSETGK